VAEKELLGSPIWVFQNHHVIAIKEFGPHIEKSRVSVVVGEAFGPKPRGPPLKMLR